MEVGRPALSLISETLCLGLQQAPVQSLVASCFQMQACVFGTIGNYDCFGQQWKQNPSWRLQAFDDPTLILLYGVGESITNLSNYLTSEA